MKIIFVCTGNTCRSPMAEGYLKSFNIPALTVLSRGIFADGSPASEDSVRLMAEAGIDIKDHISTPIKNSDLDADLFICMTEGHSRHLQSYGIPVEKITVLAGGIPDPYMGGAGAYRLCRDKIFCGINSLLFDGDIFPFKIVKADESDAENIAELEKITSSEPWSAKGITDSMHASTLFFAAKQNETLLGYVGLSVAADEGYITNIAVFPEHRKMGVATLLLNRVITEAESRRLSFVSLEVRETNETAKRLYRRNKFIPEGIRKNFYRNPTEDAIIMTRRF